MNHRYVETAARVISTKVGNCPGLPKQVVDALVAALREDEGAVEAILQGLCREGTTERGARDALCDYLERDA